MGNGTSLHAGLSAQGLPLKPVRRSGLVAAPVRGWGHSITKEFVLAQCLDK